MLLKPKLDTYCKVDLMDMMMVVYKFVIIISSQLSCVKVSKLNKQSERSLWLDEIMIRDGWAGHVSGFCSEISEYAVKGTLFWLVFRIRMRCDSNYRGRYRS